MANNIFTVKNLSFSYGKQQVLNGLDFSLHEGKITTLIGANGCGKSTLFNLMTKNLKPDQGEVFLREENIANLRLKDFAREAAIVHQYNTAPPDLTVEKLELPLLFLLRMGREKETIKYPYLLLKSETKS